MLDEPKSAPEPFPHTHKEPSDLIPEKKPLGSDPLIVFQLLIVPI